MGSSRQRTKLRGRNSVVPGSAGKCPVWRSALKGEQDAGWTVGWGGAAEYQAQESRLDPGATSHYRVRGRNGSILRETTMSEVPLISLLLAA